MKNDNNNQRQKYKKLSLSVAIAAIGTVNVAYALQEMTDTEMSAIEAQDGLYVNAEYDSATIGRVFWQDKAGQSSSAETTLGAYFDDVSLTPTAATHSTDITHTGKLHTTLNLDIGSSGASTGVALQAALYFGTLKADSLKICDSTGVTCGDSYGSFAVQSQEDIVFNLTTQNGLFNKNALMNVELGLKNLNFYLTQQASGGINNQFIIRNFNFNFEGQGYMYVGDSTESNTIFQNALILTTQKDTPENNYIDLKRVADVTYTGGTSGGTNPGLNLDIVYKGNTGATYSTTDNSNPIKGVLRLGASGRATNASMVIKGVDASTILGAAYAVDGVTAGTGTGGSLAGSQGLYMRVRADFTKKVWDSVTNTYNNDDAGIVGGFADNGEGSTLELGHGGTNAYGVEFSNLTPLLIRKTIANGGTPLNTDRAYFDTGDVYINLINSKKVQMPVNTTLNTSRLTINGSTGVITPTTDYSHVVHSQASNPNALAVAVRGFNFNAVARTSRFTVSNDVTNVADIPSNTAQNWGLGLPFYNLNANMITYGTTVSGSERLGFALGLSTQGNNSDGNPLTTTDGDKTTSIMLIDGQENCRDGGSNCDTTPTGGRPTNYYIGLRNIDMLITAYGTLGLENNKINLTMPKLTIAAAMELAGGYLPGSRYRSNFTGCTDANEVACYVPVDSFTKKDDVFLGVKLKLDGSMNLDIVPGNDSLTDNALSFVGNYDLKGAGGNYTASTIQLVDPIDDSIIGFDNITGNIGFNNKIKINKDTIAFSYGLTFNPDPGNETQRKNNVFRIRDINLYPSGQDGQRLGEIAITGGRLVSNITFKPRN